MFTLADKSIISILTIRIIQGEKYMDSIRKLRNIMRPGQLA